MSRRRALRGLVSAGLEQDEKYPGDPSGDHVLRRRGLHDNPDNARGKGTEQSPVNLSDEEGDEVKASSSRGQRHQKRLENEEMERIDQQLQEFGWTDVEQDVPLEEKKNLLKILQLSTAGMQPKEPVPPETKVEPRKRRKCAPKKEEEEVNPSSHDPSSRSSRPSRALKDEGQEPELVDVRQEMDHGEEHVSHLTEEGGIVVQETTYGLKGKKRTASPMDIDVGVSKEAGRITRGRNANTNREEGSNNFSVIDMLLQKGSLQERQKCVEDLGRIAKKPKRNVIRKGLDEKSPLIHRVRKTVSRKPLLAQASKIIDSVLEESDEDLASDGILCSSSREKTSPSEKEEETVEMETAEIPEGEPLKSSDSASKELLSPVTFQKLEIDTSTSDDGFMNSPSKQPNNLRGVIATLYEQSDSEDSDTEDESIIKRPQLATNQEPDDDKQKDNQNKEQGMEDSTLEKVETKSASGSQSTLHNTEPLSTSLSQRVDTPGLQSSPDLFASQGMKDEDDTLIADDVEDTSLDMPKLLPVDLEGEISNGPFDVFYATSKAAKKTAPKVDVVISSDASTQEDDEDTVTGKREGDKSNEENKPETGPTGTSSRPVTPTPPTALINKSKANRKLFDPQPYFAPEGVDPVTYSATILSYFDRYRCLLRRTQAKQSTEIAWPDPVMVGRHIPLTLDMYSRSYKKFELETGSDDDETLPPLRSTNVTRNRRAPICDKEDEDFEEVPVKKARKILPKKVHEKEVNVGRIRPSKVTPAGDTLQDDSFKNCDFKPLRKRGASPVNETLNIFKRMSSEYIGELPDIAPPSGDDISSDIPCAQQPSVVDVDNNTGDGDKMGIDETSRGSSHSSGTVRKLSVDKDHDGESSGRISPGILKENAAHTEPMDTDPLQDKEEKPKDKRNATKKSTKRGAKAATHGRKRAKNQLIEKETDLREWLKEMSEKKEVMKPEQQNIQLFDVSGDENEENEASKSKRYVIPKVGAKRRLTGKEHTSPPKKLHLESEGDTPPIFRRTTDRVKFTSEKGSSQTDPFGFDTEEDETLSVKKDGSEKYGSLKTRAKASRGVNKHKNVEEVGEAKRDGFGEEIITDDESKEDFEPFISKERQSRRRVEVTHSNTRHVRRSKSPEYEVEVKNQIPCPLCNKSFGEDVIEEHASACQGPDSGPSSQVEGATGFQPMDRQTPKNKPNAQGSRHEETGPCPICNQEFPLNDLQDHVNMCLEKGEEPPPHRRRGTRLNPEPAPYDPLTNLTRLGRGREREQGMNSRPGKNIIDLSQSDSDQNEERRQRKSTPNQSLMKDFFMKRPSLTNSSPTLPPGGLPGPSPSLPKKSTALDVKKKRNVDEMLNDSEKSSSGFDCDSSGSDAEDDVPLSAAMSDVFVKKKLKSMRKDTTDEYPTSPIRTFRTISEIQGESQLDFQNQFKGKKDTDTNKRKRAATNHRPKGRKKRRKKNVSRPRTRGKSV